MHKGFKCLDPSSGRVYISRDVIFDEEIFPFKSLHSNAGRRLHEEINLLPSFLLNPNTFDNGVYQSGDHGTNAPNFTNQSGEDSVHFQENSAANDDVGQAETGAPFRADPPAPARRI